MKSTIAPLITGTIALGLIGLAAASAQAEVKYFLLSIRMVHSSHGSCVVPLTDPEDIAEARRQMALERPTLIPVMRIASGADGINRDYLAPGKPAWTWRVTEFLGYKEGIIEVYESTPVLVERRVGGWPSGPIESKTNGMVGLTGYKPVAELTLEQLFFALPSVTAEGVQLKWLDLGTNYVYTVETSGIEEPPSWIPAAGGSWPITATNWTDTIPAASGSRFYRVKAQLKIP